MFETIQPSKILHSTLSLSAYGLHRDVSVSSLQPFMFRDAVCLSVRTMCSQTFIWQTLFPLFFRRRQEHSLTIIHTFAVAQMHFACPVGGTIWRDQAARGRQLCNQIVLCCSVKFHLTSKMFFHTPLDLAFCWGSYSKNSGLPAGNCVLSNNKIGAPERGSFNWFQGNTCSLVVMPFFIKLNVNPPYGILFK